MVQALNVLFHSMRSISDSPPNATTGPWKSMHYKIKIYFWKLYSNGVRRLTSIFSSHKNKSCLWIVSNEGFFKGMVCDERSRSVPLDTPAAWSQCKTVREDSSKPTTARWFSNSKGPHRWRQRNTRGSRFWPRTII